MDIEQSVSHLLEEAQLKQVFDDFQFQTLSGRKGIDTFFVNLPKSRKTVLQRSRLILETRLSKDSEAIKNLWKEVSAAESIILPYIDSGTDLTSQTESEIFFTGENTKIFNSVPYLLTILLILKIFVTPLMGITMPFMFLIAPYMILTFIMNVPIPWDVYVIMMKEFVIGIKNDQPIGLKHITQIIYLLSTFGQGMYQPIITAQHTYKTDTKICEVGSAINSYLESTKRIYKLLFADKITKDPTPIPEDLSPRDAYWWFRENILIFKSWQQEVSIMDVYYTLGMDEKWEDVVWSSEADMVFEGLSDLCIKEPVKSDITFNGHSLITGPNRGGKSSFLRGTLQQILFARVFGITTCSYMQIPWIHWIHSRIRSLDSPGKLSLFEEDVRSCANIIKNIGLKTHGIVLIDELFHSTNPPDALFCARTFLSDFWRYETVTSLISTHSFELLNDLPACVSTLCCPATEEDGKIKYSYKVQEGICKLSSVREVLEEAGFSS